MANLNKVLLMGNLTRDPQLSYLPSQTAVVDFGLAVNRTWVGKDGVKKDSVCFVDCTAFGRQAETINKYLVKGKNVFIEGRLTYESWTAQDGTKRSRHKVTVENFQFLGSRGDSAGAGAANSEQSVSEGAGTENGGPERGAAQGEDDIPF